MRSDGGERLAADHGEAGDDDRGAEPRGAPAAFPRSTTVASASPPSAAQEGWITPPWPSGTSRKPE